MKTLFLASMLSLCWCLFMIKGIHASGHLQTATCEEQAQTACSSRSSTEWFNCESKVYIWNKEQRTKAFNETMACVHNLQNEYNTCKERAETEAQTCAETFLKTAAVCQTKKDTEAIIACNDEAQLISTACILKVINGEDCLTTLNATAPACTVPPPPPQTCTPQRCTQLACPQAQPAQPTSRWRIPRIPPAIPQMGCNVITTMGSKWTCTGNLATCMAQWVVIGVVGFLCQLAVQ